MINRAGIKRIIKILITVTVLVVIIGYTYNSFRSYIEGPEIIIFEPENGSTISTSTVAIKGQVLRIQDITLNDRSIDIDSAGNFNETLLLHEGYNISIINAVDRFGRTIEYKLELVYKDR